MSDIKVSICCLAFNHEHFIRQCLDGFMMQKTNFAFEVLIHDDASTDETANIIREYEHKYPDIIKPIYQTENQYSKGVSVTATINFPRAKGKYIAMCEGDDYWTDPNKLQIQVDLLEKHNLGFSFHAAEIFKYGVNDVKKDKSVYYYGEEIKILSAIDILKKNGQNIKTPVASFVFEKEIVDKLKFEHPAFYSNKISHSFLILWAAYCSKIIYVPRFMSIYRHDHTESWSYKMKSNAVFKKHYNLKVINSYNAFNKITQFEFSSLFQININNRIFNVLKNIDIPLKDRIDFFNETKENFNTKNKLAWFFIFKHKNMHHLVNWLFKTYKKLLKK
ncbi:glycosyltransferase family 2 protein [Psychroserpens sp.]|uniref:glycosyltransferase family 2 protein n=1 Tax=Psychroserpens sp. TaxID=2020870 RepID=UPI0038589252